MSVRRVEIQSVVYAPQFTVCFIIFQERIYVIFELWPEFVPESLRAARDHPGGGPGDGARVWPQLGLRARPRRGRVLPGRQSGGLLPHVHLQRQRVRRQQQEIFTVQPEIYQKSVAGQIWKMFL